MATPIHLKHSAQAGRVPDAGVLANGELAINTKDVKAYIKNADGQVVQIAGADNPTTDGRYLRIDSGASAQTVASTDPTTFSGQVELPGGGSGAQALQADEVTALISNPDGPADGNYLKLGAGTFDQSVQSTGTTDFAGDVTVGTDKITLDATDGSATFAGGNAQILNTGNIDLSVDGTGFDESKNAGALSLSRYGSISLNLQDNANSTSNVWNVTRNDGAGNSAVTSSIKVDGSADFASGLIEIRPGGSIQTSQPDGTYRVIIENSEQGGRLKLRNSIGEESAKIDGNNGTATLTGYVYLNGDQGYFAQLRTNVDDGDAYLAYFGSDFKEKAIKFWSSGGAEFAGDVAIGNSTTFRGSIGDAVALLPNDITTQFKKVIAGLPVAKPYGATTLPADLPTPLRDALERVTTAGKINLNSDGSAGFAGVIKPDAVVSTRGVYANSDGTDEIFVANTKIDGVTTKVWQVDGPGHQYIGGTIGSSPNISLMTDGSAKFTNFIQLHKGTETADTTPGLYQQTKDASSVSGDQSVVFSKHVCRAGTSNAHMYWVASGGGTFSNSLGAWSLKASRGTDTALDDDSKITFRGNGSATFTGDIDAPNVTFNLEPDNDDNYTTTTEEYEEQEELTPYVPAVEEVVGPLGNVLVAGVPAVEATYHTVTKTREVKTYTGPTLDVKEELQFLRARATQQDEVIATLTEAVEALKAAPASDFESRIAALEVDMARFKAI